MSQGKTLHICLITALFALCSSFLFLFCLCGCVSEGNDSSEKLPNQENEAYLLGISFPTTELAFRKSMFDIAENRYGDNSEDKKVQIITKDAHGSQQQQNQDIIDLVDDGVDGIVVIPGTIEGSLSAINYANNKDIPVITVDNRIEESSSADVISYVGADHYQMGKQAAEFLINSLEKQCADKDVWKIIELTGPKESSGAIDRGNGIADVLEADERIKVVGRYNAEFEESNAYSVMEDVLLLNPDIDGVICQNDMMALGCSSAIQEAKLENAIVLVGIDGQSDLLKEMSAGYINGTVAQSPEIIIKGIECLCDYLDGKPLQPLYIEETQIVSAVDADNYLATHTNW